MFESLPGCFIIVGLVPVCVLYFRAFRQCDHAAADPAGSVVLTERERRAIRELERELVRMSERDPVP